MTEGSAQRAGEAKPDLSFVMPCYNEEEAIGYTIPALVSAFAARGLHLELVAVDNGSTDGTGVAIAELAQRYPTIVPFRVEVNQGYGWGVLQGMTRATASWVGIIPADGQVDAEDVVRLFEAVRATNENAIGKVRRRFRMDGLLRKVISTGYNVFVRILWPKLGSIDVNGSPKLIPRRVIDAMGLESKDWLLDPEIMVKAHRLGIRVVELNVFARMRSAGLSNIRASTCFSFFGRLLKARVGGAWKPPGPLAGASGKVQSGRAHSGAAVP